MARGIRKHLKRIAAPKSWLMDKMGGVFTVKPDPGPHKLRESIPLQIILRDKLKLALNGTDVKQILHQKEGLILIDKKVRRNSKFPVGIQDVIEIPKMNMAYRVLYDSKGRFCFVPLKKKNEKDFKLCKIQKKAIGANKLAYLVTHDGRTIRFAPLEVQIQDTVKVDLKTGTVEEWYKMKVGNVAFVVNGNNRGRVGIIDHINKFDGNYDLISLKDEQGHVFATRTDYVMVIGKGNKSVIGLPRDKGLRKTILEEAAERHSS